MWVNKSEKKRECVSERKLDRITFQDVFKCGDWPNVNAHTNLADYPEGSL